jgi:7-carboxy-7-deazaguanine synthase
MGEPNRRNYLQIAEIFTSLQGEGVLQGELTAFIRTAGCNLNCVWCDTDKAPSGGHAVDLEEIINQVLEARVARVCVTGGEPLDQPRIQALFTKLKERSLSVSVETNGTRDIAGFTNVDSFSVDYKLPSARAGEPFYDGNWGALRPSDELKFVIADRADYEAAKKLLAARQAKATIIFSPCLGYHDQSSVRIERALAEWIIEDKLSVRYSLQLHKILGVR